MTPESRAARRPEPRMAKTHPGPYYSDWGPANGPLREGDGLPAGRSTLVVFPAPKSDLRSRVGFAFPAGRLPGPRGVVLTFRLVIAGSDLPGRWVCLGREFVREDEVIWSA